MPRAPESAVAPPGWWVEEREDHPTRGEPPLDQAARTLGLAMEETDPDGEDLVEPPVAELEVLELGDEELDSAGFHMRRVPARGGIDHLGRTVDRGQRAVPQALADERGGDAVAAADLEDAVIRSDVQLLDDGAQSLTHDPR